MFSVANLHNLMPVCRRQDSYYTFFVGVCTCQCELLRSQLVRKPVAVQVLICLIIIAYLIVNYCQFCEIHWVMNYS